jgi:hypothetical protein
MKLKNILLSAAVCCLLCPAAISAQETIRTPYKHAFSIQPLYIYINGLRLDYEQQLKNPKHWLQVSATGYFGNEDFAFLELLMLDLQSNIERVRGGGLELTYKYFPFTRFFYTAASLSYAHFNVGRKYTNYVLDPYEENGLTYYEPRWSSELEKSFFNKVETNLYIGIQNSLYKKFLIDTYVGIGYKHSFYDSNKFVPNDSFTSLGYTGLTLAMGVRLGYRF